MSWTPERHLSYKLSTGKVLTLDEQMRFAADKDISKVKQFVEQSVSFERDAVEYLMDNRFGEVFELLVERVRSGAELTPEHEVRMLEFSLERIKEMACFIKTPAAKRLVFDELKSRKPLYYPDVDVFDFESVASGLAGNPTLTLEESSELLTYLRTLTDAVHLIRAQVMMAHFNMNPEITATLSFEGKNILDFHLRGRSDEIRHISWSVRWYREMTSESEICLIMRSHGVEDALTAILYPDWEGSLEDMIAAARSLASEMV